MHAWMSHVSGGPARTPYPGSHVPDCFRGGGREGDPPSQTGTLELSLTQGPALSYPHRATPITAALPLPLLAPVEHGTHGGGYHCCPPCAVGTPDVFSLSAIFGRLSPRRRHRLMRAVTSGGIRFGRPSVTPSARCCERFPGAFADHVALPLGDACHHVRDGFPLGVVVSTPRSRRRAPTRSACCAP